MYYTNAWDLPEDPRRVYPQIKPTPLVIENTTNDDNTTVPSGKGRPVFPWESGTTLASRKPTRTYYNYAATHEERRRQAELEAARRLQEEQEVMEQIRRQEQARYERERKKEEIREQMTGTQGFENFKLVNAWDVDPGVQWSIMKKTEQRRPRSRKSSAGGFRKGYGIEDMLAYEARQRQELYEAEIVQKRLEEEETRQREEARSKAEAIRLERLRQAKLEEEQRQRQVEGGSPYVFRNAWDPPHMALTKKKLRIEDEEVELALPLRQDRRPTLDISRSGSAGSVSHSTTHVSTTERTGRGNSTVSAAAAGAVGVAIAAGSRTGRVHRDRDTSEGMTIEVIQQGSKSEARSGRASVATAQRQSVASANESQALVVQDARGSSQSVVTTTTAATVASGGSSSLNTVKMTTPGSQRFVRTTVRTTITHTKYVNGVEVSSDTSTSTASDEKRFAIPPGPRSGSYFGEANRRTVTTRSSREASRLGVESTSSGSTHAAQRVITSGQAVEAEASGAYLSRSLSTEGSVVSTLHKVGERATTSTRTTTTTSSRSGGEVIKSTSSDITSVGSTSEIGSRKFGEALQIDTSSRALGRGEEEEQTRPLDLRQENATEAATAEAMRVLSKYPQATSRYGARSVTTSSTGSTSSKAVVGDVLYASDPNLPRQSITTSLTKDSKGKPPKVQAVRAGTASDDEDEFIYEEEDLDELEYFGERHTRAALPVDSPYMPSTPLPYGYRYSGSAVSGYSSRTGSRPTTPGPGTPSRFGPSTPKSLPKKPFAFDLKHPEKIGSHSTNSTPPSGYQSAPVDSGFSNYRIEWNLKELLGKKPRHWTATEGEEYYDPYNALSTHGSQVDSDEDGGMLESASDDSSDEEEGPPVQRPKTASSSASKGASSFATGDDNEFTRESEFVIRGGKIARRRSSVVLERREL
ncbi:MAG: hypothetical protein J3Q66DRAFT_327205 [Benniella sp.]|nr:MAG: hypothetical protein J3Q66DRAFT_327205 [Benniella sp.]